MKDDAVDLLAGADEAYALAADGAAPGWSGDGDGDDSGGARWHSH